MKKLIIFVLTLFLTFTIFLSSKSAKAELSPVTPFYEGDILNGKDLYLFQNYSATPNFESGYISKKTITNQDVFYQENSYYNGWYKNLGEDLIYEYTEPEHEPENPYFWFYIPLNNLLAQYFQFALIAPEPFEAEYFIKFKGQQPLNFLTTNGYNDYLITPPTNNMILEIEWFCFEVYFPDHMASFRPLTAQIAYEFGFSAGQSEGFDRGHSTGYTTGYNNGYERGVNDATSQQLVIEELQNYNQLIVGSTQDNRWLSPPDITYDTTTHTYTFNMTTPYIDNTYQVTYLMPSFTQRHIYYLRFYIKNDYRLNFIFNNDTVATNSINTEYTYYEYRYRANENNKYLVFRGQSQVFNIKNLQMFDLTYMYGVGNEPTLEQLHEIFVADYYPFSLGEVANVGYYTGYYLGEKNGYTTGYEKGKDVQATQQLTATGWIQGIFGGISSLLNIQIFPGVTIGIIVGIPFIISLAYFVIRAFRGGGGA